MGVHHLSYGDLIATADRRLAVGRPRVKKHSIKKGNAVRRGVRRGKGEKGESMLSRVEKNVQKKKEEGITPKGGESF